MTNKEIKMLMIGLISFGPGILLAVGSFIAIIIGNNEAAVTGMIGSATLLFFGIVTAMVLDTIWES